jgi:putative transposase
MEGIEVVITQEAYTSKCSALDLEPIQKHENYVGKRKKRGLFVTGTGKLINADCNGALNIARLGLSVSGNEMQISDSVRSFVAKPNKMNVLYRKTKSV